MMLYHSQYRVAGSQLAIYNSFMVYTTNNTWTHLGDAHIMPFSTTRGIMSDITWGGSVLFVTYQRNNDDMTTADWLNIWYTSTI